MVSSFPYASVNSTCAPPSPPRATGGGGAFACLPWQSQGGIKLQVLRCPGARHLPTPNVWHARGFLSGYYYTEDFTVETSRSIGSFVKDRKNWRGLQRHVLDFMHAFLHCLSSQNYLAKSRAIDMNERFFGYWIKFLLILFEEHPFIFIKQFTTVNFTAHY